MSKAETKRRASERFVQLMRSDKRRRASVESRTDYEVRRVETEAYCNKLREQYALKGTLSF